MTSFVHTARPVALDLDIVRPAVVYVVLFAGLGTYFPYVGVALGERGLKLGEIGVLLALQGVVSLVAAPIWGSLADRTAMLSRVLLAASIVAGSGAAILAVSWEAGWTVAGMFLLGAGTAGLVPLVDTRTVELAGERRDRFSLARAWGSAAFIVASVAVGAVVAASSPNVVFLLYLPLLLATGVAAMRLLGSETTGTRPITRRRRAGGLGSGVARLFERRELLLMLAATTLVWTAFGAVMSFLSIAVVERGGEAGTVGLVWALGAATEVPIMLGFPRLARRYGARQLLIVGALAFALRTAAWAIAPDPITFVLIAPLGGVGFGLFYVGIVGVIAASVPREAQATAQGVFSGMSFSLGSVLGSAVGGVVAPLAGLQWLFVVSTIATALGAVILARVLSTLAATEQAA